MSFKLPTALTMMDWMEENNATIEVATDGSRKVLWEVEGTDTYEETPHMDSHRLAIAFAMEMDYKFKSPELETKALPELGDLANEQ